MLSTPATANRVQPAPSTTFQARKPVFPAAAPPSRKQVGLHQFAKTSWVSDNVTDPHMQCFPQALLPAPARAKTGRFSTRTARVCAEPVSSFTTSWTLKDLRPTASWTASRRSAAALSLCVFIENANRASFSTSSSCWRQANQRCATGQIRLAASRECVSPPLYSCNVTCAPYGGSLDAEMGMLVAQPYMYNLTQSCTWSSSRVFERNSQD